MTGFNRAQVHLSPESCEFLASQYGQSQKRGCLRYPRTN